MRKVWAVAVKELRQVRRDPLSLVTLLVLPLFLLVLFGYAIDFDVEHVKLAVEDRDLSTASRALVDAFVKSRKFDLVRWLPAGTDPAALTEAKEAQAILVIPERYGEALAAGRTADVQLLLDGTDATTATTILGYAQGVVADAGAVHLRRQLVRAGLADLQRAAVELRPRVWFNPELQSSLFLVPGLIGFIMMLTGVLSTALSLVRERERGTLEQLRVAPLSSAHILLGKILPYLVLSLLAVVLILAGSWLLFGLEVRGSHLGLLAATLLFLAAALAWGLFVSTLAATQTVAFQIGVFSALLPTMIFSGFVFPIRNMPQALQLLTYIVPARYYLVILRGIVLKGADLSPFWPQMGALALYTALVAAVAAGRFARQRG